jgi:membrane protein
MIIFKHNKMKDLVLYMLPAIVIVTYFCMKINYSMMDVYGFYKDISMYDMYMIMMTDPSVEFLISIPFLLLIILYASNNRSCELMVRFKSRKSFAKYKIREIILANMVNSLIFCISLYLFAYIFTNKTDFTWYQVNSPISVLYNASKKIDTNIFINKQSVVVLNLLFYFLRNATISMMVLIVSRYLDRLYSFVLVAIPFLISAFRNGVLIYSYILDIESINSPKLLLAKLSFTAIVLFMLVYIYLFLEEKRVGEDFEFIKKRF